MEHNNSITGLHSNHYVLLSGAMLLLQHITASDIVQYLTIGVLILTGIKLYYDIRKSRKG